MPLNLNKYCHRKCLFNITLAILAISSIFLFLGGPDYDSPRSFKAFWNMGHIFYFALSAWLFGKWNRIAMQSWPKQWLVVLSLTLLAGILIEILQYGTERAPDIDDVIRDLTGSFLFLSFSRLYSINIIPVWKYLLRIIAIFLVLIQLVPLAISLTDEIIARQQFPILSNFETPFEKERWSGNDGIKIKLMPLLSSNHILEVPLTTGRYSGVNLKYFPGDWKGYQTLTISIYNPLAEPLPVVCRIHDQQHQQGEQRYKDRFNRKYLIFQGWNNIEIKLSDVISAPKHRKMDLKNIRGLGIFVMSLKKPQLIYLDDLQLSR
ncbi:MAG: VanZ family protein [Gammaproteobacteria bacterium]|nr:VanZ family protein [Gammaproteobacteria bacterium]